MAECKIIRADSGYGAGHGLTYFEGISRESAGALGLCLHMVEIPPLKRAKAHLHEGHESAIYTLEGTVEMLYGEQMEHFIEVSPGDYLHIPAGVPHSPWNPSTDRTARALIARTDPSETENLVMRLDLEPIVLAWLAAHGREIS